MSLEPLDGAGSKEVLTLKRSGGTLKEAQQTGGRAPCGQSWSDLKQSQEPRRA